MLKRINPILSPEALQVLAAMGHGEDLLIADGNYPAAGTAKRLVRFDGHGIPEILAAVLDLFPLDSFAPQPISLMDVPPKTNKPEVWQEYRRIILEKEKDMLFRGQGSTSFVDDKCGYLERFAFYKKADECFAVFASGETALYANIIIKKGVLTQEEIARYLQ